MASKNAPWATGSIQPLFVEGYASQLSYRLRDTDDFPKVVDSLSLSVCLAACLSVSLSLCLSVSLPLCLSVSLPLCLSASLPLCRSVSLSLCLSCLTVRDCLTRYVAGETVNLHVNTSAENFAIVVERIGMVLSLPPSLPRSLPPSLPLSLSPSLPLSF